MKSKMLEVQVMAIELLRVQLALGRNAKFKKNYGSGAYDAMIFEYLNEVMSVNIQAEDTTIAYRTYLSNMENKIETLSLCEESGFEGLCMDYPGDAVAVAFDALRKFCNNQSCIVSIQMSRATEKTGAMEVRVREFGSVFVRYKIATKRGRNTLIINNISSHWNPHTTTSAQPYAL